MSENPSTALQVSCVQLHWAQSLQSNPDRTLHYIRAAAQCGSRVVLFPEANLTRSSCIASEWAAAFS